MATGERWVMGYFHFRDNVLRLGVPLLDHKYIQAKEMVRHFSYFARNLRCYFSFRIFYSQIQDGKLLSVDDYR